MLVLAAAQGALDYEGSRAVLDIQAMLELIDAIGTLEAPMLVDELDLRPIGVSERPDQRMRLSLTLSAWTGDL